MGTDAFGIIGFILVALFMVAMFGAMTWSLIWAYKDAKSRQHTNPGLIVFMCFLCNWPFSLIFYVIMRNQLPPENVQIGPG